MFENDKKDFNDYDNCCTIIEKFLTICLPVTTTPAVCVGKIKTECCGNPIISLKRPDNCCKDLNNGCCKFTIVQKMKVEIPIDFTANTQIDNLFVDCEIKQDHHFDGDCCNM